MRRPAKRASDGRKAKARTDRGQVLIERIRRRREQIRERVGVLQDSAELIREERERRF